MQLIVMHKILMGAAIFSGVSFSLWSLHAWSQTGQASSLVISVIGLAATAGVALYLKRFIAKHPSE